MEITDLERDLIKASTELSAYLTVMEKYVGDARKLSIDFAEKLMFVLAEHRSGGTSVKV